MLYSNDHSRNGVKDQTKKQPPGRSRNKSDSPSYNRSSNRYDSRDRRQSDRGTKELHTVICSKCKKETTVPFKPTGSKPVYCRECFQSQKPRDESSIVRRLSSRSSSKQNYRSSTRSSGRYEDRSRNRTDRKSTEIHTVICSKCKKETTVPFKPTGSKPVYCRECFQDQKPKNGSADIRRSPGRSMSRPNYRSSTRSSGRYEDRSRNRTDRKSTEIHTVICSKCKKETTVPFKPTGIKPVYCRECFQSQKPRDESSIVRRLSSRSSSKQNYRSSTRSSGRYEDRSRYRTDRKSTEIHTVICSKCKKETTVPFKPTGIKPVYCRECFQDQKTKGEPTQVTEGIDQDQKTKREPTQVTEGIEDNTDEVVERFGDRTGPYRVNKRMHSTTCETCNKEIMIPFKPKEDKPIYCQDCFQKVEKKK